MPYFAKEMFSRGECRGLSLKRHTEPYKPLRKDVMFSFAIQMITFNSYYL